jgi:tRNA(Leu) C34 or U34 (ribose-2'-O)-methylase TrmL
VSTSPDAGPTEWVSREEVGVGPWPGDWPTDERYDPDLLRDGDRRNVVDAYRYWRREANAFAAAEVHIVGRRRWNRRGAMVTDRYQHLRHHDDVSGLVTFAASHDLAVVAVDNTPGSEPVETASLPRSCVLVFGQEGPGLSAGTQEAASLVVSIAQFGTTRSINAGVAAGIVMHAWVRQHADLSTAW